jgi:hypothetical protein
MALINVEASLPTPMWALTRFLLTNSGSAPRAMAESTVAPNGLQGAGQPNEQTDRTFGSAVSTLRELKLITDDDDCLKVTDMLREVAPDDFDAFTDMLRQRVLYSESNVGLATGTEQTGPKDLVRALTWFLTLDPLVGYEWSAVEQLQVNAFPAEVGPAFVNAVRWNLFVYWEVAPGAPMPRMQKRCDAEEGQRSVGNRGQLRHGLAGPRGRQRQARQA